MSDNISFNTTLSYSPPTWDHEVFFVLAVLCSIVGSLSGVLCSLVLVRGARHAVLSQLLNSLVRADSISCVPLFVRCVALAWQDWTFGELVCKTCCYVYETMQSVRCSFLVLLLLWHVYGLRGTATQCDNVTFLAWFLPMATGLVVMLDAQVLSVQERRTCSSFSATEPLLHHVWYVTAVVTPTCSLFVLAPLAASCVSFRRGSLAGTPPSPTLPQSLPLPHTLPNGQLAFQQRPAEDDDHRCRSGALELVCLLAVVQLVCTLGAIVMVWIRPGQVSSAAVYHSILVPVFTTLPILMPLLNFPACYALMPDFRESVGTIFVERQ